MTAGREDEAADAIAATVRAALADADMATDPDAVMVGAGGVGRTEPRQALEAALDRRLGSGVALGVTTDMAVALQAALRDGPGIVLNAGTGSFACARDAAGTVHRVGGLGWRFGDEGSGYALGRDALGVVARAADGRGPGSVLSQSVAATVGADTPEAIADWAATAGRSDVARLARAVCEAALVSDGPATALVERAAEDLVAHARALIPRFPDARGVRLALCGALLQFGSPLRTAVQRRVERDLPMVETDVRSVDPPLGALVLATRLR